MNCVIEIIYILHTFSFFLFRLEGKPWKKRCLHNHWICSSLTRKIARHEISDWCTNPTIPYSHCVGQATTLDVDCYPPPAGAVTGAPGKRQTVVERLKRRLEVYTGHQGSCLRRYDQAANRLYDTQRQETLLLKQKFLEAKAKKTRRNDHHGRNTNAGEQGQRNSVVVSF